MVEQRLRDYRLVVRPTLGALETAVRQLEAEGWEINEEAESESVIEALVRTRPGAVGHGVGITGSIGVPMFRWQRGEQT